jgi:hypothetical protein
MVHVYLIVPNQLTLIINYAKNVVKYVQLVRIYKLVLVVIRAIEYIIKNASYRFV